jgi:hypothetical protein
MPPEHWWLAHVSGSSLQCFVPRLAKPNMVPIVCHLQQGKKKQGPPQASFTRQYNVCKIIFNVIRTKSTTESALHSAKENTVSLTAYRDNDAANAQLLGHANTKASTCLSMQMRANRRAAACSA